jgi:enoyl-CoA hydratase/carnithine racemase
MSPRFWISLCSTGLALTLLDATLCENVNAERALALGMINRVVPRDDLLSEARRKSEQLAAFNHDALWMTKRTIQRAASMSPADALEMAGDASLVMRLHAPRGGS